MSRQGQLYLDLRGRRRRRHRRPARSACRPQPAQARSRTTRQRQLPFDGIQTVGCAASGGASPLPSPSPPRSRTTIRPATRPPRRLTGSRNGWGVDPQKGKPHAAIFVLKQPLHRPGRRDYARPEQQLGRGHLIGRPRISMTTFVPAESATPTPESLAALRRSALPADASSKVGPLASAA